MKKKDNKKKTPTTGICNITNESRGRNKQNAQTTHKKKQNKIHHKSQLKEQEKKIVQIHRQRKDAHSTTSLHMFPL